MRGIGTEGPTFQKAKHGAPGFYRLRWQPGSMLLTKPTPAEGSLRCMAARSYLPRKLPLPGTFARGTGHRKNRPPLRSG
jgi:hypothetical protein